MPGRSTKPDEPGRCAAIQVRAAPTGSFKARGAKTVDPRPRRHLCAPVPRSVGPWPASCQWSSAAVWRCQAWSCCCRQHPPRDGDPQRSGTEIRDAPGRSSATLRVGGGIQASGPGRCLISGSLMRSDVRERGRARSAADSRVRQARRAANPSTRPIVVGGARLPDPPRGRGQHPPRDGDPRRAGTEFRNAPGRWRDPGIRSWAMPHIRLTDEIGRS